MSILTDSPVILSLETILLGIFDEAFETGTVLQDPAGMFRFQLLSNQPSTFKITVLRTGEEQTWGKVAA